MPSAGQRAAAPEVADNSATATSIVTRTSAMAASKPGRTSSIAPRAWRSNSRRSLRLPNTQSSFTNASREANEETGHERLASVRSGFPSNGIRNGGKHRGELVPRREGLAFRSMSGRSSMLVRVAYVAGSLALGGGVMAVVNARMNDAAASPTTNARTGNRFPPPSASPRTIPRTIPPPRTTVAFSLPRVNRTPLPTFAPPPPVVAQATVATPAAGCSPHYSPCVPIAFDVDCAGGPGDGPAYVSGPIYVIDGQDPYGLDGNDNNGIGCENP